MRASWVTTIGSTIALLVVGFGAAASSGSLLPAVDNGGQLSWDESWNRFLLGWQGFASWRFLAAQTVELVLATGLAALIAYHPRNFKTGFVTQLDMIDQPKTLLVYAMVAAMVAEIVQVYPAMAFVVFGIGGLLRFRTDLGMPKLTGRAILVTVIGLAIGLELFPLALLGTAFGWLLIFLLEKRAAVRIRIRKLPAEQVLEASDLWQDLIERNGGQIISTTANDISREIEFLVIVPVETDRRAVQVDIVERIPVELRGKVDITVA